MSVVCGIVYMDNSTVRVEMGSEMMDKVNIHHFDTTDTWYDGHAFLGCGILHITPESEKERLPFYDTITGLAITADAIIDNRKELFDLLNISLADRREITDSQLILMSYMKWGEESPKFLIGDFAFVIWNPKKQELFCARDHVGKQTFYYYYRNNSFIFCTLMKPILSVLDNGLKLNEEWIADYLSISGVLHEIDYNKTIYKDIMQLPPAHTITINSYGIRKVQYWHPLHTPELRLKSDYEYEEAFRDVFYEAVKCRLRSTGNVGVMLSGGLDSGSVASVAAIELEKQGKRLKAFSAIPISGYKEWLPKSLIADESSYIDLYNELFKNIDITYSRAEGKNSLTNIDMFLTIFEQPYKIIENLFWVDDLESIAAQSGCKVILDGQFGNLTISYGDLMTNILTLYKKHQWISLSKEILGFSKLYTLNPLSVARVVGGKIFKLNVLDGLFKISRNKNCSDMVPVNPELAIKWGTNERIEQTGFGSSNRIRDLSEVRRIITNNVFFSHLGPLDTKSSLANGLARRDPTRDKRVIEFCMSVPGDQYVRNGQDRYLVRRAMAGVLPEQVRTNTKFRGKQSADWIQRISPEWKKVKDDIEEMLDDKSIQLYFDINKLKQVMHKLGDSIDNETVGIEVRMLLISLIFYKYLKNIQKDAV